MESSHPSFEPLWTGVLSIHHWPAFLTVVCLGLIQVIATYYSAALTIESLPRHVSDARRHRHRRVLAALFLTFVCLTFALAKLNDSTQHDSEIVIQQERAKQEALQNQLRQTLDAVLDSQERLRRIKQSIDSHPPGTERSLMLTALDQIEHSLETQATSMERMRAH